MSMLQASPQQSRPKQQAPRSQQNQQGAPGLGFDSFDDEISVRVLAPLEWNMKLGARTH
ncbi:hypothetical protein [Pseudomonas frederiksbergensis]|uniref:hypothetical protein n=1 Tax=Pseudomonas frederiksbergensis TaxID=104087 RepID=UPI001374718D|nr:hypothetical protein [Pseudomonas frederiksbergensis]